MPIPVTDLIAPTAPSDTYATHDSQYGKGGLHEVATTAARDAIPTERRTAGMLAHCSDTGLYYSLGSDLTTWSALSTGGGGNTLVLAAGEDLTVGDPVYVSANTLLKADNITNFRVIGVISTAASLGFSATATIGGSITLTGLAPNSPYFLGSGIISATVPSSGFVVRMGTAISTTTLLLNIEEPVLLA